MKTLLRACGFLLTTVMASMLLNAQWVQTNGPFGTPVWAVAANGSMVFAATDDGVARSTDNGVSWSSVKIPQIIRSISFLGSTVFAGAQGSVYRSIDNGLTWVHPANKGVTSPQITSMCSFGAYLFAGNVDGVFRSTDGGDNWAAMSTGLSRTAITGFAVAGTRMFASVNGTGGGVFRSNDSGSTWTKMSSGITDSDVMTLASSGTTVYAGCGYGEVFRSTDNAASWGALNTGLQDTMITSLTVTGSTIVAGTRGAGTYRTTNNGAGWTKVSPGLTDKYVNALLMTGSTLIAGTLGGVFRSSDNAATWTEVNTGLVFRTVNALAVSSTGTTIFAGCKEGGIYRSQDGGAHWYSPNTGLKNYDGYTVSSYALAVKGSKVIAGTDGADHAYRSTDDGVTWTGSESGLPNRNVASLFVSGSNVFAGVYGGGVYRSSDDGVTWTESDAGLPPIATVNAFVQNGQYIFVGPFGNGIYLSTDNGANWTASKTGFPISAWAKSFAVGSDNDGKTTLFAGTESDGVYRSTDNGVGWTSVSSGLPQHATVNALARIGTMLFAGTEGDSVCVSTDNGTSWTRANKGLSDKTVNAFLLIPNASGSTDLYAGTGSGGVFRYTGNTSVRANIAVTRPSIATVGAPFWLEVKIGERNAVAGLYGIAFKLRSDKSTCSYVDGSASVGGFPDAGVLTYFKMANPQTLDIAVSKTTPPGMNGSGVLVKAQYISTVGGNVQFTIEDLSAIDQNGVQIPLDTTGLTISFGGPVARPVGIAPYQLGKPFWVQIQVGGPDSVKSLYGISLKLRSDRATCTYVDGSAIAGTLLGTTSLTMFRKVDAQTVDLAITKIAQPGVNGNGIVAKAQFVSATTEGVSFSLADVTAINQNGAAILLGAEPFSIASILTDVDDANTIPAEFELQQNYPNPFNPATTIRFALPQRCSVSLKVFDVLGREIASLISQELDAGSFSVRWQPNVPSGTYIYQFRAGQYLQTKRMVLLK